MKVTDYERVAEVVPTQLGQFHCPKCVGVCDEVSPEKQQAPPRREFNCKKCGRGWVEVPKDSTDVVDACATMAMQRWAGETRRRDDSRDAAEQSLAALLLVKRTLPIGYGSEQSALIDEARSVIGEAANRLRDYIRLRNEMPSK